jgi:hypothetical protein
MRLPDAKATCVRLVISLVARVRRLRFRRASLARHGVAALASPLDSDLARVQTMAS